MVHCLWLTVVLILVVANSFIVYEPQPHLDGVHTVFGKVIEGMDVVDGIHQGAIMETVEVIEG